MIRDWLIRLACLALPPAMRARQGRALAQTLRDDARRPSGRTSVSRLAAGLADVVRAGLAERARGRGAGSDRLPRWAGLFADAHRAVRAVARRPAVSIAVVMTLALGLGASTSMFAVLDAVLLRPLPYPDGDRLALMSEREASRNSEGASFPALAEWAAFPEVTSLGAWEERELLFAMGDAPQRLPGASVSPTFFQTLGVEAVAGRTLLPADPQLDPEPKIVLSHAVWQERFGGDPAIVGRVITLEDDPYLVAGVMPRGFAFPAGTQFWTTLPTNMKMIVDARTLRFFGVVARLAPDASVAALSRRLADWKAQTAPLAKERPDERWTTSAVSLRDAVVGEVRPAIVAAFLGVGLLMLAACANVATLMLADSRTRRRQFAVQAALGAGRGRIIRQVVLEGLCLAAAAAGLGVLIAALTRDALVALSLDQIPRIADVEVGWRAAAFALGGAAGATLLITAAPAWWLSSRAADLRAEASRTSTGSRGSRRLFGTLLAAEFAVALVLVAAAGLLVSSYRHVQAVDVGVRPGQVLTAEIHVPLTPAWQPNEARRRLIDSLVEAAEALPGVTAAGSAQRLPLEPPRGGVDIWRADESARKVRTLPIIASEGYLDAIGARLVAGRDFSPADTEQAPPVVILNDVVASALWPGESAIGRRITYEYFRSDVTAEVIGVVKALRYEGLTSDFRPELYRSYRQAIVPPGHLVVRTSGDPLALLPAIRARLAEIDPSRTVTLADASTLTHRLSRVSARPRFYLVVFAGFAAIAFMLSAFGIHGTMAFWMRERWREMGIRMALGASRRELASLLMRRGVGLAAAGVGAGLAIAIAGGRFIEALLFQVAPTDASSLGAAVVLLLGLAFLICLALARRFAALDPADTLRVE